MGCSYHHLLFVAVLLSCRADTDALRESRGYPGHGIFARIDSVVLDEPDSVPLGQYVHLSSDGQGASFLSDGATGRLLRFDQAGVLKAVSGRRGSGPGEFQGIGMLHVLPGDSLGAVMDQAAAKIVFVSLTDGAARRSFPVPFQTAGKQWHWSGSTATFSLPASPSLFAMWDVERDSVSIIGTVPEEVMSAFPVYMQYGHSEVVPWREFFLAQLPTRPGLSILDSGGAIVRTVDIPRIHRRGQPADLVNQHEAASRRRESFTFPGSAAATLAVLSTGEVASLQADIDVVIGPRRPAFTNRYYLSLLSPDLSQACPDILIPFDSDAPFPIPHFAGDTLLALSRRVDSDSTVRTVVYRFTIDSGNCTWVPTARGPEQ